jgi:hypothetical protein
MSNEEDKYYHSKRLLRDEAAIKRQVKIAKAYRHASHWIEGQPQHKYSKVHAMNCGRPTCVMCGNPRKFFKSKKKEALTFQERKLFEDIGE